MKSTNNMVFLLTCTCVLMLFVLFVVVLVIIVHNKNIYMSTNHSITSFVCIPYINAFFIHKSSWSCLLP
jgi:hypothetical protein